MYGQQDAAHVTVTNAPDTIANTNTNTNNSIPSHASHAYPQQYNYRQPSPSQFSPRAASAGGAGIPLNSNSALGSNLLAIEQAEQSRLLTATLKRVEEQAYYMKYVIDSGDRQSNYFAAVMDYAFVMLQELCTGSLTPKYYYELYIKVVDELQALEDFFVSICEDGIITMQQLYEVVQYAPKAVPRLYMQITAGSAYVKYTEGTAAKEVWSDLIGGIKCVQCPLRGLFLRTYLSHVSKHKLFIGIGNVGGVTVDDAYSFLMKNFVETTKLWVRIQHLGGSSTKEIRKRREKERIELRILVGANLVTLSQLDSLSVTAYKDIILPQILEQILLCKDTLAQGYLMDCVVHAFPDEFHMETLDVVLSTIPKLKEKVNVHNILQSIMDRLSDHVNSINEDMPAEFFQMFGDCIAKILDDKVRLPAKEVIRIQIALLNFTIKCHPSNMDNIDYCLASSLSTLVKKNANNGFDSGAVNEICNLLTISLNILGLKVLELRGFTGILKLIPWQYQRQIALKFLKSVCQSGVTLSSVEHVENLFATIAPLLKENSSSAVLGLEDQYVTSPSFQQDQHYISKVIHILEHDDTDILFKMYSIARKSFSDLDAERIKYTLVPLFYACIQLLYRVHAMEFLPYNVRSTKPNKFIESTESNISEGKRIDVEGISEIGTVGDILNTCASKDNDSGTVENSFNKTTS